MKDSWDNDATIRLLRWMITHRDALPDYAPDSRFDEGTRAVVPGPKTIHIADCLKRWAEMWAQDMREAKTAGIDVDQDAQWRENMRHADAEIDRFLAGKAVAA